MRELLGRLDQWFQPGAAHGGSAQPGLTRIQHIDLAQGTAQGQVVLQLLVQRAEQCCRLLPEGLADAPRFGVADLPGAGIGGYIALGGFEGTEQRLMEQGIVLLSGPGLHVRYVGPDIRVLEACVGAQEREAGERTGRLVGAGGVL